MAKSDLTGLLILIVVIEICAWVFLGVTTFGTALLDLFTSDSLSSGSAFWTWITDNLSSVIGIAGAAAIAVGTALATKNDFAIFAGIALVLFSYGTVFFQLQQQIASQFNDMMTLEGGGLLATIIVIPIVILYIVTILKFWRGTD